MLLGLTSIHPHFTPLPLSGHLEMSAMQLTKRTLFQRYHRFGPGQTCLGFLFCLKRVCKTNIRFVTTVRVNKITLKSSKLFQWFFFLRKEGHQQFSPHRFPFARDCEHDVSVYFTFVSVFNTVIHLFRSLYIHGNILCHTSTAFIVLSNISNKTYFLYSLLIGSGNPHLIIFSDTAISSTLIRSD